MIRGVAFATVLIAVPAAVHSEERPPPRLVLQITVRQPRGEMPIRI